MSDISQDLERRELAALRTFNALHSDGIGPLAIPRPGVSGAPMYDGPEHGPCAERVRIIARPTRGFRELRGWLVDSLPMAGKPGMLSLVIVPGVSSGPLVIGTHETRLGWH